MKRQLTPKQIEDLYSYRQCRGCRCELSPELLAQRKEKLEPPLCEECFPRFLELYKKCQPLMGKLLQH